MDAAVSIRPCEIDVTLGGVVFTVPALPAADWLTAIIGPPGALLPGLLPAADQHEIYDMLARGDLDPDEVSAAWRDLIAAATGRSWWSASRLCASASDPDAWPVVHGKLLTGGIDLEVVSVGALCNAIFFMILSSSKDDEERSTAKFELELPPPGFEAEVWQDREQIAQDFLANLSQLHQLG